MAINLGEAFYKLTLDDGQFDGKLTQAKNKVQRTAKDIDGSLSRTGESFKKLGGTIKQGVSDELESLTSQIPVVGSGLGALGVAGGVAAAAFVGLGLALNEASKAMQFADDLDAISNKIGVSAEYLQKMQYAAGDADVDIGALNGGLEKLNASLGAFKSGVGDGRVLEAFNELGIDQAQIASMNDASDLLPLIAERLAMVGSKAEQVQLAKKLGIEELLPLLLLGKERISALGAEAERLGVIIDNETTASLAEMSREVEIASLRIDVGLKKAFLGLAPILVSTANLFADLIESTRTFAAEYNRAMNITAFQNRGATRSQAEARADLLTEGAGTLRGKGGRGANMFSGSLQPAVMPAQRAQGGAGRSASMPKVSSAVKSNSERERWQKTGWEIKDDEWMKNPTSLPGVKVLENDIESIERQMARLPEIVNPLKETAFEIADSFSYAFGQAAAGLGDFGDIFEQELRRMVAAWVSTGMKNVLNQLIAGFGSNGGGLGGILSGGSGMKFPGIGGIGGQPSSTTLMMPISIGGEKFDERVIKISSGVTGAAVATMQKTTARNSNYRLG
jgi:hypothetical protein